MIDLGRPEYHWSVAVEMNPYIFLLIIDERLHRTERLVPETKTQFRSLRQFSKFRWTDIEPHWCFVFLIILNPQSINKIMSCDNQLTMRRGQTTHLPIIVAAPSKL